MSDVLAMAAIKDGAPVVLVVLIEIGDYALHVLSGVALDDATESRSHGVTENQRCAFPFQVISVSLCLCGRPSRT